MRPPRIAYILLHFPYLTETFVAEEIQAIRQQGIEVSIISLLGPGPGPAQPLSQKMLPDVWYAPGVLSREMWRAQFHYVLGSPRGYWGILAQLLRHPYRSRPLVSMAKRLVIFLRAVAAANRLRNESTDLLHSHFAWLSGAAAWICSRLLDMRFTVTTHAHDLYFSNDLLALVANQADHVVTISDYNRQHLETKLGHPHGDISVIHCGVKLPLIRQKQGVELPPLTKHAIRILSVGSLQEKKGHTHLIDACQILQRRGIEFRCSIVGAGPAESALRGQIREANLQNRVQLLGARPHPDIVDSYFEHDIFVLASVVASSGDMDGIPVVLMEAGAAGLPLVSTRVSGIPELVRHGQTGLLVEPGNAPALADAIATLAADPALRERLGQEARLLVYSEFDIETSASRLASVFLNVAESAVPHSANNSQKATGEPDDADPHNLERIP